MRVAPWSTSYATLSKSMEPTDRLWPRMFTPCRRVRAQSRPLSPPESLECDDGTRVLDAGYGLYFLRHEVADIRGLLHIKLHQQIEVARSGINLGGDFGVSEPIVYLVGLAKLTFDLDEKRNHPCLHLAFQMLI